MSPNIPGNVVKHSGECPQIVLSNIDIYTDEIIKISSATIVIKSLIEKDNKFYLELSLNHCLYEI